MTRSASRPDTKHPFGALRVLALAALLLATPLRAQDPPAAPPSAQAAQLEAALAELRELRQARQRLRDNWAEEQAELARLTATETARADAAEAGSREIDIQYDHLRPEIDAATDYYPIAIKELAAIRAWVDGTIATFDDAHARGLQPVLVDEAFLAALPRDPDMPLPERVERLLASLDAAVERGWSVDVSPRVIRIGNSPATTAYDVRVLRLGGALELFVTVDGSRCGYRPQRGERGWAFMDARYAPAIAAAIAADEDGAAGLTPVPVPWTPLPPDSPEAAP